VTPHFQSHQPVLVSACLLGVSCRFDGGAKQDHRVIALAKSVVVVPVCPEQLGGLATPRPRHERNGNAVVSEHGVDATAAFERGAREAARIAVLAGCRCAVLKARSPSCGLGRIYDGTFTGVLTDGNGVLVDLLLSEGLSVYTEDDVP